MSDNELTQVLVAIAEVKRDVVALGETFGVFCQRQQRADERAEYQASEGLKRINDLEQYRDIATAERRIIFALVGGAWALVLIVAGTLLRMNLHI